ncbi:MAG: hypothetical protein QOK49_2355, partial [Baekduia sp.]|nr:hypothetical protein [Baekduia sp.]
SGGPGGVIDVQKVDTLDWLSADSDGDGLADGQDDVDHDGIDNMSEYQSMISSPFKQRKFGPLDACVPTYDNTACLLGSTDLDGDGLSNAVDTDDDGDGIPDVIENQIGTNPLAFDTDGDGVSDGFEYYSALDLNKSNLPYPGKRPYPNPLDKEDGNSDFDGDSMTQLEEYQAWMYESCGGHVHDATYAVCHLIFPLTYSDGNQSSAGLTGDAFRDVDNDGLQNWVEISGPLSGPAWWDSYVKTPFFLTAGQCGSDYVESRYPGPAYLGLDFVDHDTDGDGVADGADDIDHDGYTNLQESSRPSNWCNTYDSMTVMDANGGLHGRSGGDPLARMQPFNPCKPTYSRFCHNPAPMGYYSDHEDWASPYNLTGPN